MNTRTCLSDADLSRLWEGDVTPGQKRSFERHLAECPHCTARWERMCAGAEHALSAFRRHQQSPREEVCLPEAVLKQYVDQGLSPDEQRGVDDHLRHCSRCEQRLADLFVDAYAREGASWWAVYIGRQILRLVIRVPEEIEHLLERVQASAASPVTSRATIRLAILAPAEADAQRLAAATGEGFAEQVLRQEEPPFEFHLVKFGEQIRVTARALGEESSYRDCLARLRLFEEDTCRLSRFVLIERGQGRCALDPEEVRSLRPDQQHLVVKLEPLFTAEQLDDAGVEAYMPILTRLLKHDDPGIRRGALEVLARIRPPETRRLVEPLADDLDESVRSAARKVLDHLLAQ